MSERVGFHGWDFRGLHGVHMTLRPADSHVPKWDACHEGSDGLVTSTAAPLATGWSDPVGRAGIAPAEISQLAAKAASQRVRHLPYAEHRRFFPGKTAAD